MCNLTGNPRRAQAHPHPYREQLLQRPDLFWRWNWRSRQRAERTDARNDVRRIRAELNDLHRNVERMGRLVVENARALRERGR